MTAVFEFLVEQPAVLTFLLIGLGMFLGHRRVKGVKLGAAAVLFLAIAVAAWAQAYDIEVRVPHLLGHVGLLLFAFAIGNNSGASFFQNIKRATGPIIAMLGMYIVVAGVAYAAGKYIFGMDIALIGGTFAGALTNTPALAAVGEASGDPGLATVGYAVAYLFGVIGMLIAAEFALRRSASDTDAPAKITHYNVRVERTDRTTVGAVMREVDGPIEFSRLRRGEQGPIWIPESTDVLEKDDLVTIVGSIDDVERALRFLGHRSSHSLRQDRRFLDFRRITLSETALVGKTVGELDEILEERWGAKVSRVRRGDNDMLAIPSLVVEMGDRVRVVGPTMKLKEISHWLGDSSRGLTDINPVAFGLGLALGAVIGAIPIPVPGGSFTLGGAAGVLIVGLVMGKLGKVGNFVTAIPNTVNAVIAELGLLIFLAQAGTNAGGQIAEAFTGGDWWKILILGFLITGVFACGMFVIMRKLFQMGGTKLSGLLAGAQTQPAVLGYANSKTGSDPRVALGYALVYPAAMFAKIIIAQILGAL